jgi:hypothetical protein
MNNTSVVQALIDAGLYKKDGRMARQTLQTTLPDGQVTEHTMAEIDYADLKTMADELDILIAQENPWVQALYAKNAVAIANAIRVVNVESASGFKGAVGSGRQLDIVRFRSEQFQDPAVGGVAAVRAGWVRVVAAAPQTCQLICAQDAGAIDAHGALTMGTTEAILVFGFANPSWVPCTSAIQITYLGRAYNIQNADFDLAQVWEHYPIIELKEPFILYPREDGLVTVRYYQNGNDETQPIGLWIKMSQNLRALATS